METMMRAKIPQTIIVVQSVVSLVGRAVDGRESERRY